MIQLELRRLIQRGLGMSAVNSGSPSNEGSPSGAAQRALRIVGEAARPLSKMQAKFNKLVARIERLRSEHQLNLKRWDKALADYVKRIHPLEVQAESQRLALLRILREIWTAPKGVSKKQRFALRDFSLMQIAHLTQGVPAQEQDLAAWETELKEHALRQIKNEVDTLQDNPEAQEELRSAGLDFSKIRPEMTPDEQFAEMMRQMSEANGPEKLFEDVFGEGADQTDDFTKRDKPPQGKKATVAQARADRREAELAEARKRGIATIYKQLAKVLHPDLEQDPVRRAEKEKLMQELTVAYRAGDLHTLLRLELEFIHREQGDLIRLGEDKLKIYCELLTEQAKDLEEQGKMAHHDPRYVPLRPYVNPFFGSLPRWDEVEEELHEITWRLSETTQDLSGVRAKERLAELLRVFKNEQRRRSRFDDLF